jgi:glycosyltransferase involved in cell wall biosynthesis
LDGHLVRYVGSVERERRSEVLGRAQALLHLVNFEEPFGFSVVEAMACGTPVNARPRGAIPEIVRHGENGFLVTSLDEAAGAVSAAGRLDRGQVRASVEEHFSPTGWPKTTWRSTDGSSPTTGRCSLNNPK